ncbi:L-lysine 6-monooxygenase (NADPH-requiring)-domain-containing protein [Lasiosphaeria hispida]|uniref:L-ornithine N(5)-monooxygenase [NAD(P)H] n=1 Tax=Lasiosphaeria hispida TaxID=260671 RepID=A0AAJ0HG42_9PEZI|nr:L-lysine 6-monooxygenase (NADPH-requiring)-domain-containing protein [Lasiosphaeria hispida]
MDDLPEATNGSFGVTSGTNGTHNTSNGVLNGINGHANGSVSDSTSSALNGSAPIFEINGTNGTSNGHPAPQLVVEHTSVQQALETNGTGVRSHARKSQYLKPTSTDSVYDLVCIGFGPASLAIAVALHDAMEAGTLAVAPKILFIEKQSGFAWHAGMLLPGAKMQISFIKDMASLRDPRSNFTFLNYLHKNDRLVEFINLDTFLPARVEYEDYLRWCASHFDDVVRYQSEVLSVSPVQETGPLKIFTVTSRDTATGVTTSYQTKNVVLAVGGQPSIPKLLPAKSPRVIHSSQYSQITPKLLSNPSAPYRVAVVGAGQSAAEIFNNVQSLYPNSKTWLIMRSEFLKPSDDSPFVNSIFNPSFTDYIYPKSSTYRASILRDARATNYGVVRLELIEHLYEKMYHQRRTLGANEKQWPHRIMPGRSLVSAQDNGDELSVKVANFPPGEEVEDGPLFEEEDLDVDLIVCATGYQRGAHLDMLKDTWSLLPKLSEDEVSRLSPHVSKDRWIVETADGGKGSPAATRVLEVNRNYGVRFTPGVVAPGSGVWLQGCCEGTHGLSDTLLSVLSVRGGEMVESIFGAGSR